MTATTPVSEVEKPVAEVEEPAVEEAGQGVDMDLIVQLAVHPPALGDKAAEFGTEAQGRVL